MTLALESNWGYETLDLGSLVTLGFSLFEGEWPANDVLSDIILLCVCACVRMQEGTISAEWKE